VSTDRVPSERVLAIDLGSSAVKAAIVDGRGVIGDVAAAPIATSHPGPGRVEQHAGDWWTSTLTAVGSLAADERAAVSTVAVTGQMQDLLCLDADGEPLRPVVLYSDTRAAAEHDALVAGFGDEWAAAVGAPPDATSVLSKWAWLEAHEPDLVARTARVVVGGGAEAVRRLTGVVVSDHATAATTGLYELRERRWWHPAIARLGSRLPELDAHEPRPIRPEAADELGLSADAVVVLAPGDAVAATVGVIGAEVGRSYASLGTSGWVAASTSAPATETGLIVLPGLHADHWIAVGPVLALGSVIDWARTELLGGVGVAEFEALAATGNGAAAGIVAVPHLSGTRDDPTARAAIVGLSASTARADIASALLEGTAQTLRQISERLVATGHDHGGPVALCGGGALSDAWCQTIADVLGREIERTSDEHASLLGAAIVAGLDLTLGGGGAVIRPRPERSEAHRALADVFNRVDSALRPVSRSLLELVATHSP
jgi:xylulokinase